MRPGIIKVLGIVWSGVLAIAGLHSLAQCPSSISLSIRNNTAASCPSSGSITVGSNAAAGALQYTIVSGPSGAPLNAPQSDSVFNALPGGIYTFKANCVIDPLVSKTITVTVNSTYTPISNIATNVVSNCGSGVAGGTITTTGVTGGKAPFQYSVIKNNDASYPDNLSNYGSTMSYNATSYGVYQIRVKDGCGQVYTKTVEVVRGLPPVKMVGNFYDDLPCGSNQYSFVYWLEDSITRAPVAGTPYWNAGGLTVKIYEATAACTKTGTLLASYTGLVTDNFAVTKSATGKYYIEVTTPCGNKDSYCADYTDGRNTPYIHFGSASGGCGTGPSPATMSIYAKDFNFLHFPVTISVVNKVTGVPVSGSPFTVTAPGSSTVLTGLTPADYIVTSTDGCGRQIGKDTVKNVLNAGTPSLSMYMPGDFDCVGGEMTSQEGTARVGVQLNGYIPGSSDNPTVKIISGPSNVGITGLNMPAGSTLYYWQNMLPGSYTLRVTTACGTTDLPFTVTLLWGSLSRHIKAMATSFCGGNGRAEIDPDQTEYNGYGALDYVLLNTGTGMRIDSNTAGVFTNLPAGTYSILMKNNNYCSGTYNYLASNVVTINATGAAPLIVKKIGVVCEDVNGNQLTKGSAFLELAGVSPLKVTYRKQGASSWTTLSNNAPNTINIDNLEAGVIYDVLVLDGCGISTGTQVAIGALMPIRVSNTLNPCINQPYTLSIPEMPGAVYSWKNPGGVVVSNQSNFDIANYNASYDGIYTCTVTLGSCVSRVVSVGLNSTACGIALPVTLLSFAAERTPGGVKLDWKTSSEKNSAYFEVQRSTDGRDYQSIAVVNAMQNSQAVQEYHFTDVAAPAGTLYYRLKMTDQDGSFRYSNTRIIRDGEQAGAGEGKVTLMPNPVMSGQQVALQYEGNAFNGTYQVINTAGQTVTFGTVHVNTNAQTMIALPALNSGMYILRCMAENGTVICQEKLTVR
jgi:hypothetical protein